MDTKKANLAHTHAHAHGKVTESIPGTSEGQKGLCGRVVKGLCGHPFWLLCLGLLPVLCLGGSRAGTLGVPLGGPRRVGGLLGVAGRLSGTVSPFRAEQGTSLVRKQLENPYNALPYR